MTYKGIEIGIPTIEQFEEFIKEKKFKLDAEMLYNHYKDRNWLTKENKPIKELEAIISVWNGILNYPKLSNRHKQRIKNKHFQKPAKKPIKKEDKPYIPYSKQLKDIRWEEFKHKVFYHKGCKCEVCGGRYNLQVHHNRYLYGHYAWEYKMKDVTVLCKGCHSKAHFIKIDDRFEYLLEKEYIFNLQI